MTLPLVPTGPTPLSIVPCVALVEVNESLVFCPTVTVVGFALNVAVTAGAGVTVTVACAVPLPPAPVAVKVYMVVVVGMTVTEPFAPTGPMLLSMEPWSALVEVKERIVCWPEVMLAGLAASVAVGLAVEPPLLPLLDELHPASRLNKPSVQVNNILVVRCIRRGGKTGDQNSTTRTGESAWPVGGITLVRNAY